MTKADTKLQYQDQPACRYYSLFEDQDLALIQHVDLVIHLSAVRQQDLYGVACIKPWSWCWYVACQVSVGGPFIRPITGYLVLIGIHRIHRS